MTKVVVTAMKNTFKLVRSTDPSVASSTALTECGKGSKAAMSGGKSSRWHCPVYKPISSSGLCALILFPFSNSFGMGRISTQVPHDLVWLDLMIQSQYRTKYRRPIN